MIAATGLGIHKARDGLAELLRGLDDVDHVVVGGPRELPPTGGVAVFIQSSTGMRPPNARGTLAMASFELRMVLEASADWVRDDDDQAAADRAQGDAVRDRVWSAAESIAAALERDGRSLGAVTGDLVITSEDSGYAEPAWLARIWAHVTCVTGPHRR